MKNSRKSIVHWSLVIGLVFVYFIFFYLANYNYEREQIFS